jgi:hypothetical protein
VKGEPYYDSDGPTRTDTAVSEACTRSGAFALVLSVLLGLLATSWSHRPSELALANYISSRSNLTMSLERLDEDPDWERLRAIDSVTDLTPLGQLPNQVEVQSAPQPNNQKREANSVAVTKPDSPDWRPLPPTGLTTTIRIKIPEVPELVGAVDQLNDSAVLSASRAYSNFFDVSITHWAMRRAEVIYRNSVVTGCAKKEIEVPHKTYPPEARFVPQLDHDVMMACLNLADVRELASFEPPPVTNTDQIGTHVSRDIDISPSALPRERYIASLVSQALLFFVLIYCGAFVREATLSRKFPVEGTLFGAFSRSPWTLIVMLLAIFTPFIASLAVAIASRRQSLCITSVLILIALLSIVSSLQSKSYWSALNPKNWRKKQELSPKQELELDSENHCDLP